MGRATQQPWQPKDFISYHSQIRCYSTNARNLHSVKTPTFNMRIFLIHSIILLVFGLPVAANAQEVLWVDADQNSTCQEIAFDASGGFWRFLDHESNYVLGDSLLENKGRVLVKNNPDGKVAFIQPTGVSGIMRADKNGNMYVMGLYGGDITIQGTKLEKPTSYGLAILKYGTNGKLLWVKTYNGTSRITGLQMGVVKNGVKFTFNYQVSVSYGTDTLKTNDTYGLVMGHLDGSGTLIEHVNNVLNNQLPGSVFAFAEDGSYSLGSAFKGSVVINGQTYSTTGNNQDVVFALFDKNHNPKWSHHIVSVQSSIGFSTRLTAMAFADNGELLVGGVFKDRMKVGNKWYYGSSEEGYFLRYTTAGSLEWVKHMPMEAPQRIIPIDNGNWVVGATLGKYDDPSTDSCKVNYNDDRSIYAATFNSKGECVSVKTFGGTRDFFMRGLDAHPNGKIAFKGRAYSSLGYGNNIQYRVTNSQLDFTMILGECEAPSIEHIASTQADCTGESVTLKPQFYGQVQSLEWIKDGKKVSKDYTTENHIIDSISQAAAGDYWLKLTGACGSDSMPYNVDVPRMLPSLNLMAKDTFCEGSRAQAIITLKGESPFNYSLVIDNDTQQYTSPNSSDTLYFEKELKLKPLSVSDKYCGTIVENDSVTFQMQKLPVAKFISSVTDFSVWLQSKATFHDKLSWDFGDGNRVDDEANPKHTFEKNGTYSITLIAENDCGADTLTREVVIDAVGVPKASSVGLKMYPNPASSVVTFSEIGDFKLYSTHGQLVLETNNSQQIGISGLPAGQYLVKASVHNQVLWDRLVVE